MIHADTQRVYLDHNATSPVRPEVLETMQRILAGPGGNPSSMHSEGRAARKQIEDARLQVAGLTGAKPSEVVFTSGGSEAISAAVRGVSDRAPTDRRRIVISATEHSAVHEAAKHAVRRGMLVVTVPCGPDGRVDVERFKTQLSGDDVALAALHWANNETGVLQPLEEVGRACRLAGIPFLVDAVQAAGKMPIDPREVFADMMAISGHKLGGPQGTGALIVREGITLAPLVSGGAQEKRRRGGTEAVCAIAGFGVAAALTAQRMKEEVGRLVRLRARLETRLREIFPDVRFHAQTSQRLPNTTNFALPGVPGETLVIALDLEGFAVSTGSACASGAVEPSHVLLAMGLSEEEARSSLRVSTGWSTTGDDIDRFLDVLPRVVGQVRKGLGR
ncbi:hypothetical protein ABI59_04505 [Acidobacteria bacterium Mor1]|nr:hypothetical protein ABI59_04505 [Acidobacteria bacterium Mor1]